MERSISELLLIVLIFIFAHLLFPIPLLSREIRAVHRRERGAETCGQECCSIFCRDGYHCADKQQEKEKLSESNGSFLVWMADVTIQIHRVGEGTSMWKTS